MVTPTMYEDDIDNEIDVKPSAIRAVACQRNRSQILENKQKHTRKLLKSVLSLSLFYQTLDYVFIITSHQKWNLRLYRWIRILFTITVQWFLIISRKHTCQNFCQKYLYTKCNEAWFSILNNAQNTIHLRRSFPLR